MVNHESLQQNVTNRCQIRHSVGPSWCPKALERRPQIHPRIWTLPHSLPTADLRGGTLTCYGRERKLSTNPPHSHLLIGWQGGVPQSRSVDVTKSYWKEMANRSEMFCFFNKYMWCMNLQGRRPGRKSFTYLCDPEPYSLLLPPRPGISTAWNS